MSHPSDKSHRLSRHAVTPVLLSTLLWPAHTLAQPRLVSFDDVLDFIFTANAAKDWPSTSTIVVTPSDFPDDAQKSDHRPVIGASADGQWLQLASGAWVAGWQIEGSGVSQAGAAPVVAATAAAPTEASRSAEVVVGPAATPAPAQPGNGNAWLAYTCTDNPVSPPDPACPIKGNISSNGQIYHSPGQRDYCKTVIDVGKGERWFCSAAEAEAAGWRAAKR